jgi:hypothetical protein
MNIGDKHLGQMIYILKILLDKFMGTAKMIKNISLQQCRGII